jgi:hypothetical protein
MVVMVVMVMVMTPPVMMMVMMVVMLMEAGASRRPGARGIGGGIPRGGEGAGDGRQQHESQYG